MKKLNKFLSGILSIAMAASCVCTSALAESNAANVSADAVTVISTLNYANDDWKIDDGNNGVGVYEQYTARDYILSVPINVAADGAYYFSFEAVCSASGATWFSPIDFKIDEGEYVTLTNPTNVILGDETGKKYGGESFVNLDYIPSVDLTAGNHTLYLKTSTKRGNGDVVHAMLSDITVTPKTVGTIVAADTATVVSPQRYANEGWEIDDVRSGVGVWNKAEKEGGYELEIPISVMEGGVYKLSFEAICTVTDVNWFSPIKFKIDNGTYEVFTESTNVTKGESTTKGYGGQPYTNMDYISSVYLSAGVHTLRFMTDTKASSRTVICAAISNTTITPLRTAVSGTEKTVIPRGTYRNGGWTDVFGNSDLNGATTAGGCELAVSLKVEETGAYNLSFDGLFDFDDLASCWLSTVKFKVDNGEYAKLINGTNITVGTEVSNAAFWGNALKTVAYNKPLALTKGTHTLFFKVDTYRTQYNDGYYAAIGDITLQQQSKVCAYDVNEADGKLSAKLAKADSITGEKVYVAVYSGNKFKAAYMPVCESGVYTIENVAVAEGDTVQCLVWKWDGANNRVTTVCDDAVTLK